MVARDGGEAVFRYARLESSVRALPGRVRVPGLREDRRYRVRWRQEAGWPSTMQQVTTEWFRKGETVASGAVLAGSGLQMPNLNPAQVLLLHFREV